MMSSCLYECLKEAGLEKFYTTLKSSGFDTAFSLLYIPPADLQKIGIKSDSDRQRFLQLVQIIASFHQGEEGNSFSSNEKTISSQRKSTVSPPPNLSYKNSTIKNFGGDGYCAMVQKNSYSLPKKRALKNHSFQYHKFDSDINSKENFQSHNNSNLENNTGSPLTSTTSVVNDLPPDLNGGEMKIKKILHNTSYNYGLPEERQQTVFYKNINSGMKHATPRKIQQIDLTVDTSKKITVCVRKRPLLSAEISNEIFDVITTNEQNGGMKGQLVVHELKQKVDLKEFIKQNAFMFDFVFDEKSSNENLYSSACRPLVDFVMTRSHRATCFCYGQTGAGKSHTLLGSNIEPGLFLYSSQDILKRVKENSFNHGLTLWISLYEIYCGKIFDLLNNQKKLSALEDGNKEIHINGLKQIKVNEISTLVEILQRGLEARSVGVTATNPDSSRSHAIVQLVLKDSRNKEYSRFSFIDLAGSERACDALQNSDKQNRLEGAEINQSLLALKECIRSLDQSQAHTPFRQSKLTQVLRDSFIGDSKTCMIANVSPAHNSLDHTMNTLRYAYRVKELRKSSGRAATATPKRKRTKDILYMKRPQTAAVVQRSKIMKDKLSKPVSVSTRSLSIDSALNTLDSSFVFQGAELQRTPPHSPNQSIVELSSASTPLIVKSKPKIFVGKNLVITPDVVQGTSTPCKSSENIKRTANNNISKASSSGSIYTAAGPLNTQDNKSNMKDVNKLSLKNPNTVLVNSNNICSTGQDNVLINSLDTTAIVSSTVFDDISEENKELPSKSSFTEYKDNSHNNSSEESYDSNNENDSESRNTEEINYGLPQSRKNTGLPSPKKFLTYLKGRQSMKTKEFKRQLHLAKEKSKENTESDPDSLNKEMSSSSMIRASHQLSEQSSQDPKSTTGTPPRLPSPKPTTSFPRRSSRCESDSPGSTGGRSTPTSATNVKLTSASEFHSRIVEAFVDENKTIQQKDIETSHRGRKRNKHKLKSSKQEKLHKAQSAVVIAHQEHISEILRVSIEEERLYNDLRDGWDGQTSFSTYTTALRQLLTRKVKSIEALKMQLAVYDRIQNSSEEV